MLKGFALPLVIGAVFITLVLVSVILFLKKETISKVTPSLSKESTSSSTPQASNEAIIPIPDDAFVAKAPNIITGSDSWFPKSFPKEIINNKQSDLVGFKCTDLFQDSYEKPFVAYNPTTKKQFEIKDERILNVINEADISANPKVMSTRFCESNNDLKFLIVGQWVETPDGLKIYFIDDVGKVTSVIKSASDGVPYFGCDNPLQLTINDILYISCSGGDGGLGKVSIYKVDINNKTTSILLSCTSLSDGVKEPEITCS